MTPDKMITRDQLAALEVPAEALHHLCGSDHPIKWTELAKHDGQLALRVLSVNEFDRIKNELIGQGLPAAVASTPNGIVEALVAYANSVCPRGAWYDLELTSSVACATLIRLAQTAWGHDDIEAQRLESEAFAAKLLLKAL
jgi:hypothetical protein